MYWRYYLLSIPNKIVSESHHNRNQLRRFTYISETCWYLSYTSRSMYVHCRLWNGSQKFHLETIVCNKIKTIIPHLIAGLNSGIGVISYMWCIMGVAIVVRSGIGLLKTFDCVRWHVLYKDWYVEEFALKSYNVMLRWIWVRFIEFFMVGDYILMDKIQYY